MYLVYRRKNDNRNLVVKYFGRRERDDMLTLKHYLLRSALRIGPTSNGVS